jgi:hypothetical protein
MTYRGLQIGGRKMTYRGLQIGGRKMNYRGLQIGGRKMTYRGLQIGGRKMMAEIPNGICFYLTGIKRFIKSVLGLKLT